MSNLQTLFPSSFVAKVRGQDFQVSRIHDLPTASLQKIVSYGLQRILNDSAASAKTDAEAIELAAKRWDNLRNGVIRASGNRVGDPVKRRALELAEVAVKSAPGFISWLQSKGLKLSDKAAIKQLRAQAEKQVERPGNDFMAQAKIDVEAQKGLSLSNMDFDDEDEDFTEVETDDSDTDEDESAEDEE